MEESLEECLKELPEDFLKNMEEVYQESFPGVIFGRTAGEISEYYLRGNSKLIFEIFRKKSIKENLDKFLEESLGKLPKESQEK